MNMGYLFTYLGLLIFFQHYFTVFIIQVLHFLLNIFPRILLFLMLCKCIFCLFLEKSTCIYLKLYFQRFYLFLDRMEGREKEREREHQCVVAFHMPCAQPRHVPWLGIEPATLWFSGQCSVHWATPVMAPLGFFF